MNFIKDKFLLNKESRYNAANVVTYTNITFGLIGLYNIAIGNIIVAVILAWIAGVLDIADGKVARKYNLSSEVGIQLDSYADFISFVILPSYLLFYTLFREADSIYFYLGSAALLFYIINGLQRLVIFNIKSYVGNVDKYFVGLPTPLGAIFLFILFCLNSLDLLPEIINITIILGVALLLNSNIKVRHP